MQMLVDIDVPDLPAGIAFYTDALGLQHSRLLDHDVAELTGGSAVVYLLQKSAGTTPAASVFIPRSYERHWTPVHVDFVVDDLDASVERAERAGARREGECCEWRGARWVTFSDPFGHGFCLIAFADGTYH